MKSALQGVAETEIRAEATVWRARSILSAVQGLPRRSPRRWGEQHQVEEASQRARATRTGDRVMLLLQEFMEAGCEVEPGCRSWEHLGAGEGGIAPDGMVYLTFGPFVSGWHYIEFEKSAKGRKRAGRNRRFAPECCYCSCEIRPLRLHPSATSPLPGYNHNSPRTSRTAYALPPCPTLVSSANSSAASVLDTPHCQSYVVHYMSYISGTTSSGRESRLEPI